MKKDNTTVGITRTDKERLTQLAIAETIRQGRRVTDPEMLVILITEKEEACQKSQKS